MLQKKFLLIFTLFVLLTFDGVESATRALMQRQGLDSVQLKEHLEALRSHLEDTIERIDHNIRVRQAEFETEVQTPDGEYLQAAVGNQNEDLLSAAAIPQVSLPLQNFRKNFNSGLRR